MGHLIRSIFIATILVSCALVGCVTQMENVAQRDTSNTLEVASSGRGSSITESEASQTPESAVMGTSISESKISKDSPASQLSESRTDTAEEQSTRPTSVEALRLTSIRQILGAGELDRITEYVYRDDGLLARATTFAASGGVLETIEYTYVEQNTARSVKTGASSELISVHDYLYDNADRITTDVHRDSSGNIQTRVTYEYDSDGRLIMLSVQSGKGELVAYDRYKYSRGKLTNIMTRDKHDNLLYYTDYEYDASGSVVAIKDYSSNGHLDKVTTYAFDSERRISELRKLNGQNNLLAKERYAYTETGEIFSITYYSSENDMEVRHAYSYEVVR